MNLEGIHSIGILGAGLMGHGIAQSFLMGGYPVTLYDIKGSILEGARRRIKSNLELFHRSGLIAKKQIGASLARLTTSPDLGETVSEADFILEAAPEDLGLKQELFQQVEEKCKREAILASNTSSLLLKKIGARVMEKDRLVGTHWFNPPHIVPAVEVVKADFTKEATVETTCELLEKIKKVPVRIKRELPGFLVNRIQMALAREALDLYEKGVASAADIDRAVKGSIGFRLASIGPLLTMDLGGLKLWLRVLENLLPEIQSSATPPEALVGLVSQGHDGVKSGHGFYDYSSDSAKGELDEIVLKRDQEFLQRLKHIYWEGK